MNMGFEALHGENVNLVCGVSTVCVYWPVRFRSFNRKLSCYTCIQLPPSKFSEFLETSQFLNKRKIENRMGLLLL